jgi:antitoxin (DNA-binding transcriptional repressor) of toxin-antitoxin stability system
MYGMKRYPVAVLRARLAEALDAAYAGVPVVIERKGVRYRLTRESAARKAKAVRSPLFEILDPAVMAGNWTWDWSPDGMTFVPGKSKK